MPASLASLGDPSRAAAADLADAAPSSTRAPGRWGALARAGAVAALLDAAVDVVVYSYVLRVVAPGRLWQGVAATVFGRRMLGAGGAGVPVGLLVHVGVAYAWAAAFWLAYAALPPLRRATRPTGAAVAVGAAYGVLICAVMQGVVVPLAGGHGLSFASWRFALQAVIHVVAVGVPIVFAVRRRP